MNNDIWINQLLNSFVKDSKVRIYFEKKDKLNSDETILNLSIHPLRFADDIFFNFETNDEKIKEKLKKYEVNYDQFYHYADTVKATCLKTLKRNDIKENSILLVGQTQEDKVIFNGTKYLTLLDYIEEIKHLSQKYSHIYFKPHPYAKNNKEIFKLLKKEFKNISLVYDNVYHLLSNEHISHVVGLNSSVLYEAKYFKKEVTFLYKPYFDFQNNDVGIYGDYFNSSFWADILDVEDTNISLPFFQNRLRKSINDFWGYNEISDEIILKDIIKSKVKYFLYKFF